MATTHRTAIFVATLLQQVIGGLWYEAFFKATWQQASGITDEKFADMNPGVFVFPIVFAVTSSIFLLAVMQRVGQASAANGAALGLALWVLVVAPCVYHHYVFQKKARLAMIDLSKDLVGFVTQGAILGFSMGRKDTGDSSKHK